MFVSQNVFSQSDIKESMYFAKSWVRKTNPRSRCRCQNWSLSCQHYFFAKLIFIIKRAPMNMSGYGLCCEMRLKQLLISQWESRRQCETTVRNCSLYPFHKPSKCFSSGFQSVIQTTELVKNANSQVWPKTFSMNEVEVGSRNLHF